MINEEFVKNAASLNRPLQCLNGFRAKFGVWPTQFVIGKGPYKLLKDASLTPAGLKLLKEKVRLILCEGERYIALDNEGRAFNYGSEGWEHLNEGLSTQEWIGFGRLWGNVE
jgi:hypothetical protein